MTALLMTLVLVLAPGVSPRDCSPLLLEEGNPTEAAILLDLGWTGHAGDDVEAVYPPGC